jgi:hypothetical protein
MTKSIIFSLTFVFWFLSAKAQVDEQTKFKMFCSALHNLSTSPTYIVISVKNKNLGETKEICTEAPFIRGAMASENGNSSINCKNYKNRYFEFSKENALSNINFDLYTENELNNFAKSINIIDIIQQVKNGKLTTKTFNGNRKEQIMFAHLMFNNGIMMTRGCIAGNICGLTYFKRK